MRGTIGRGLARGVALAAALWAGLWSWATERQPPAEIGDKTLVAWVRLGSLTQRGGSALTLIDPKERFDAIVFGERAAGRWMAGSDFFKRTARDQSAWPAETADPQTTIQLAIVYQGRGITLYRNARKYAAYEVKQPQPFGDDAMVLIGLRYVGAMGEIGFLRAAIEDARIYGLALSAELIAALRPNQPSEPKALAWWPFEDGKADDAVGRFPATRLLGGARVRDGALHLGGDGYLWAARDRKALVSPDEQEDATLDRTPQTMFYKARSRRTGTMWDTWLYHHQGTHYLFYLAKASGKWDNISMATSPDGVHWTEHGRVLSKGRGVTWMGTGSTWPSPQFAKDRTFFLNFSEWRGPRQTIFFAESKDLLAWTRLPDRYEFVQDERWYEPRGRWDCIWTLAKPDGTGLYGYWTATPKKATGGRFGFGQSADGITWEALAPPKVHGVGGGEVGAIEKVGDRYYMMFGHYPTMRTLVAERPEGPFHAATKNLVLLDKHTYFSRFYPSLDGLLVNHHAMARNGQVYFAPLKRAAVDDEGTLRLAWWGGNEKAKHRPVAIEPPAAGAARGRIAMLANRFDSRGGIILEGTLPLPAKGARRPGLYVACGADSGAAVLVGAGGVTEIGPMRADGSGFKAESRIDREMPFGQPARFRLLLRDSLIEFYLDDVLIDCHSLPADATGRVGLIGGATARNAWECEEREKGNP